MHPRGSAAERSRPARNLYPAPLPDAPPTKRSRLLQGAATPRLHLAQVQGPCNRLRRAGVGTRTNAQATGDVDAATPLYLPSKTGGREQAADPVIPGQSSRNRVVRMYWIGSSSVLYSWYAATSVPSGHWATEG